jgi:membrane associated rhomboid family serine protease
MPVLEADNPVRHRSYAVYALLLLEAAVFAGAAWLAPGCDLEGRFGFIPAEPTAASAVTSLFVHGFWPHLLVNLVFLWMFAASLEASLGPLFVTGCFLACGLAGEFAHCLVAPATAGVVAGTSGAISGLLGLHLALYGRTDFVAGSFTWRGRRRLLDLSVTDAVIGWVIVQGNLVVYVMTVEPPWAPGVGYVAQLAGFGTGLAMGAVLRRRRSGRRDLSRDKSGTA